MKKHNNKTESHTQNGNRSRTSHQVTMGVKSPNITTRKAIAELEAGEWKRFSSVDVLMENLNADD